MTWMNEYDTTRCDDTIALKLGWQGIVIGSGWENRGSIDCEKPLSLDDADAVEELSDKRNTMDLSSYWSPSLQSSLCSSMLH